jgi:predicted nucleic acid-binding protein
VVELEIREGMHQIPELQAILDADWLQRRTLTSTAELQWYQSFGQRLIGRNGRNRGETSVLAWAMANGDAEAVLDDAEARKLAREFGVPHRGTLRFIVDAVRDGHLGRQLASDLADEYLMSGARLPFRPGEFIMWAEREGLLEKGS